MGMITPPRFAAGRRRRAGYSLVSTMMAMVLLAIGVMALAGASTNTVSVQTMAQNRTHAVAIARSHLETLRMGGCRRRRRRWRGIRRRTIQPHGHRHRAAPQPGASAGVGELPQREYPSGAHDDALPRSTGQLKSALLPPRRGFSLPELLIALTIGMVVIVAGTGFAVQTFKSRRGWMVREGIDRNARFVGISLQRDAAEAGVALESSASFASVNAANDTLSLLSVRWMKFPTPADSIEAPVYPIYDDGGAGPTYPLGVGNCGAECLEVVTTGLQVNMQVGDLLQLRVGTMRRLLLVTGVTGATPGRLRITFLNVASLAQRPSGLSGIALQRSGTSVQQVRAVLYWRDVATRQLMRADRFSTTGLPQSAVIATDLLAFTPRLHFTDGNEAATYNGMDADSTNDGNDIIGLRVRALLQADRIDPAVNGGERLLRWYEWQVSPRNLVYEKNRTP